MKNININSTKNINARVFRSFSSLALVYILFCIEFSLLYVQKFVIHPQEIGAFIWGLNRSVTASVRRGLISVDISEEFEKYVATHHRHDLGEKYYMEITDLNSGRIINSYKSIHNNLITDAIFYRDASMLLTGGKDGVLKILNLETELIETELVHDSQKKINSLTLSHDESFVVVHSELSEKDNALQANLTIWDIKARKFRCTLSLRDQFVPISIRSDDNLIATVRNADGEAIQLIDPNTCDVKSNILLDPPDSQELLQLLKDGYHVEEFGGSRFVDSLRYRTLAFSPDNQFLAVTVYRQLWIYDVKLGKRIMTIGTDRPSSEFLSSIAFSPDGKYIAAGSTLGNIHVWDLKSGKLQKRIIDLRSEILNLKFIKGGKKLVSVLQDAALVRVWNINLSGFISF